jgi:5-methylcytosine-specific restriction endonuclease McrA
MLLCPYCGESHLYREGRSETGLQRYSCSACLRKFTEKTIPRAKPQKRSFPNVILCPVCSQETTNPKFCSTSCAATYNNKLFPKRQKASSSLTIIKKVQQRYCRDCHIPVPGHRRVCDNCKGRIYVDWTKRTIADIHSAAKYQVSSQLRSIARQEFKQSKRPRICQNCGYDKHIEVCHIHAIQDFPPGTPVSVVSGIDNLVALCPNCHWEFDHGILHIQDIPGFKPHS